MTRLLIFVLALFFFACNDKKTTEKDISYTYEEFASSFKTTSLPFSLKDSSLLNNKDTAIIRDSAFIAMLRVSAVNEIFGKGAKVKYIPLWKIEPPGDEDYFIIKAQSNRIKTALLLIFDKDHRSKAGFPLLVPDSDPSTTQVSGIDKAYTISRSINRKQSNDVMAEGKDVFTYDKATNSFVLVMTDALDEKSMVLINPIDTLSKQHKLAGDYTKDKKNIVSVRDGRKPNMLTVFVHIEKGSDCIGEIKGDATISSPTSAVYQQAGDPCVLRFNFTASSVRLTELEGCGSRRGLGCLFEGSFIRKKAGATKVIKGKIK